VIAVAGSGGPSWDDVPLYVLAFAAQVLCDVASTTVRERSRRQLLPGPPTAAAAGAWE